MTDKSNSTKPWSSICKLKDTPRGTMTVPRHYHKSKEWVVPHLLEWPSYSLAYGITQLTKTNHTFHSCHIHPLWWETLWTVLLSESSQIYLLPIAVSFTNFFAMRHQEPELLYVLKPGTIGFAQPHVPVGYNGVTNHSTESLPCGFESRS